MQNSVSVFLLNITFKTHYGRLTHTRDEASKIMECVIVGFQWGQHSEASPIFGLPLGSR